MERTFGDSHEDFKALTSLPSRCEKTNFLKGMKKGGLIEGSALAGERYGWPPLYPRKPRMPQTHVTYLQKRPITERQSSSVMAF
mmetsp:Transcript_51530/g.137519  ORF Transcript_51530/g.137519 Transcript_51530/m.137519 type:complete len:84 (+) Transcript_51530:176-427(+)